MKSLSERDSEAVRTQAHGLRSALGVLKAHIVHAAAVRLEETATGAVDWTEVLAAADNLIRLYDRLVAEMQANLAGE